MEKIQGKILQAIKDGNYEISYEEPNCVSERTALDGRKYLFVSGDDVRFGADAGSCTVKILDYSCTCSLSTGEWDGDEQLIDDETVLDAIMDIDKMYYGILDDDYSIASFYCFVNGLDDLPCYNCYSDEMPVDADNFTPIDECDEYEQVTFKGEKYIIVEEYDDDPRRVYACNADESPDIYGYYPCVILTLNDNDEVVAIETCDESFNGVDGYVE